MRVNSLNYNSVVSFKSLNEKPEDKLSEYLKPFAKNPHAVIPPYDSMRGLDPNKGNVFEFFFKLDDVTRKINFVKTSEQWEDCMMEEMQEFIIARKEYEQAPTVQNFAHMEEEMGDISTRRQVLPKIPISVLNELSD